MFVVRRLALPSSLPVLQEPILRREVLSGILRSVQVQEDMEAQAQAMLADAQQEVAQRLEQAEQAFWQRAEAFFQSWEAEREQDLQALVAQIDPVLQQALAQLLGEVGDVQRVAVLLDHLLRSQQRPVRGRLHCHPEEVQAVTQWLSGQPCEALWAIQADHQLERGQIFLSTDTGEFNLDWKALQGATGVR